MTFVCGLKESKSLGFEGIIVGKARRVNKMYIYKLESLLQILNYDSIEIFTKTKIKNTDIQNIKYFIEYFHYYNV